MGEQPTPVLSVIMPTFNRRERLATALAALAAQDVDVAYEIIVVSDGSTDGTDAALAALELGVPLVAERQENAGPSAARNRGVDLARGEILVFVDDDIVADPGLLSAHLAAQRAVEGGVVVTGPMLTPSDHEMSSWVRWEQDRLERQYGDLTAGTYEATGRLFYTGNASVPRRFVVDAGGFDTRFRRAEDLELGLRMMDGGAAFAFEPAARGYHYAERSFAAWQQIASDYGANEIEFARRWPELIEMNHRHWHDSPLVGRVIAAGGAFVPGFAWLMASLLAPMRNIPGRPGQLALSLLYKLRFTVGLRDGLGGKRALWRLLRRGEVELSPAASS